jgi:hypothetical protein
MESMRRAKFAIDHGPAYTGYSDGSTWNGWETPYFEFDTAQRILAKYCAGLAHFDVQRDTFVIQPRPGCYSPDPTSSRPIPHHPARSNLLSCDRSRALR